MGCHICELVEKENDSDLVFETEHWGVLLSYNQRYLGRCYIFSKRHFGSMSEMTEEEIVDFFEVVRKIEGAIKKAFGATLFNWACFMNGFFKKENPNPHVHWHMTPRYRNKVEFGGEVYEDKEFGFGVSPDDNIVAPENVRSKIVKEIQKNL